MLAAVKRQRQKISTERKWYLIMKKNAIVMHSSVAASGNLVTNLRIAKEVGFDCVELTVIPMIKPYLEAGALIRRTGGINKRFLISLGSAGFRILNDRGRF